MDKENNFIPGKIELYISIFNFQILEFFSFQFSKFHSIIAS